MGPRHGASGVLCAPPKPRPFSTLSQSQYGRSLQSQFPMKYLRFFFPLPLAILGAIQPTSAQVSTPIQADHGTYYEIRYSASGQPDQLIYDSIFSLWVPEGVAKLRGVIVHQHG